MDNLKYLVACAAVAYASLAWGDQVTYYYTDPQGTVLMTADAQGNVLSNTDRTPLGRLEGSNADGSRFAGHVDDPDTGLIYMQARFFDPDVGRFLSVDPVARIAGDLFAGNPYAYALNNPYSNTDPDGRSACPGQSPSICLRADVPAGAESRVSSRSVVVSDQVASAMVAGKSVVAVRRSDARVEKIGWVVPGSNGASKVVRADSVTTTSDAYKDTATAIPPADAQAVIHGHIDGRSNGVVSDTNGIGDFQAVKANLPNGVVSQGRVGVNELSNGLPQMRMLSGAMSTREQALTQDNLNRVLQTDFLNPEANQ